MEELAQACDRLEASVGRMQALGESPRQVLPGARNSLNRREKNMGDSEVLASMAGKVLEGGGVAEGQLENRAGGDPRFEHSWAPAKPSGPGPGWFWIPKGRLTLDMGYPARPIESRRFGYVARKIRVVPPRVASQNPSPKLPWLGRSEDRMSAWMTTTS